ncbi:MAG: 4Fe-4S dicluster domain-containing protein [Deltaproteobacteria bacterium]
MGKNTPYEYITDRGFKSLIKGLLKERRVYGTVKKDGFPAFKEISAAEEIELLQTPTHLSAKEFFFPQREVLLKFDIGNNTHEAVIEAGDQAIIGLHPCDIRAIGLMDRVFSYGTADVNYLARRERTIIIGSDCMPDEYCFCKSLGNTDVDSGFDIFLHRLKRGFIVRTGTKQGKGLIKKFAAPKKPSPGALKELEESGRKRENSFTATLEAPAGALPGIYAGSNESPVWERIGNICYGCGSCNNVCPTCYCFDVKDEVKANLNEGARVRTWDGCTLDDFARVSGGHDFRKTRAERLRHRFNRKFRYLSDRFNSLFCVGCGRCSRTCLVKINIAEITNELIRESYKK